jgi:hypothetical protein
VEYLDGLEAEVLDAVENALAAAALDATHKDVSIGGAGPGRVGSPAGPRRRAAHVPLSGRRGGGTPFLPPVTEDIPLDLVETRTLGSRVIYERYRRVLDDSELLFQVLTEREEHSAVAIASNEPFSGWTKTFTDPRLCAAIVDRLTFAGQIIETGTMSYRLAHARQARSASSSK